MTASQEQPLRAFRPSENCLSVGFGLELLNDYQIGLIQKEELQEAIGEISLSNYIAARKCFYQKYGYYPIKVPVYGLDGFDILRFEKGGSYNDQC